MILEEKKKYLVISDLHIGFENTLSSNKVFVGKNSSIKQITNNVKNLIQEENVKSVILLGDVKSSTQSIYKNEWNDVPYFFDEVKKMSEVILIPGNHDGNIQKLVPDEI